MIQRSARDVLIRERMRDAFDDLSRLVAFAGDHQRIARFQHRDGFLDRLRTVADFQRTRRRSQAIKQFIMDSRVVVGVGNIYANESLFMSRIKPTRKAGSLTRKNCADLVRDIQFVLQRSIDQGGTTLRDFVGGDGKPGYFKQQLLVYGRGGEACAVCAKPLKEIRMNDRTTVYCTHCQK